MKKLIRAIIIILALAIMSYSGYKLIDIYTVYAKGDKLYDNYANEYTKFDISKIDSEKTKHIHEVHEGHEEKDHDLVDFKSLENENKDVIGWIYSKGTPINYPIVQSNDNSYYLRRMLDHSYNLAGSIFMDYRNSSDLSDLNTIIYGHNMKNDTMFGTLKKYNNQEYYEKHSTIYLITPEVSYEIDVIAGYVTDTSSEIYKLPETKEDLKNLYSQVTEQSTFETNTEFNEGDRLITLSTCSYEDDDSRFILVGII